MTENGNLDFTPRPIQAVGLELGDGPNIRIAFGIIQRTTALRAYHAFSHSRDWMEKLASAYVVALATRSADTLLMRLIQNDLSAIVQNECPKCRDASIGVSRIRETLFPELTNLREHANSLVHHLDEPGNRGVADLNVEGVFEYCHHLFQDNAGALFGRIPDPRGRFEFTMCKSCRAAARA